MLDSLQSLLDALPEGAIQVRDGVVRAANSAARRWLPQLTEGAPLPDCLALPGRSPAGGGQFTENGASYSFSFTRREEGTVILFRPEPRPVLTADQLDGALRQLRQLLGEFLAELGPEEGTAPAFGKSYYRAFRLMNNLDYLRQSADGGVSPARTALDLDGLCRDVAAQAREALAEAGIALDYEGEAGGLLIPGDPELLRRLLLGLIANATQACPEGRLTLALRRAGNRALLTLSDNGPLPDQRQLDALLSRPRSEEELPLPGQGAGLGLTIARDIVALHGGSLLVEWGQSSPILVVSLPTGPLDGRTSVRSPRVQMDGGLDPVLVELADVLPANLFRLDGLR